MRTIVRVLFAWSREEMEDSINNIITELETPFCTVMDIKYQFYLSDSGNQTYSAIVIFTDRSKAKTKP